MSDFTAKREQLRKVLAETTLGSDRGDLLVGMVMTPRPTCIAPDHTALELVELFYQKRFRHMLVAEGDKLVGVISDRDILSCIGFDEGPQLDKLRKIQASDLMSSDIITVGPGASLVDAVTLIVNNGINCLPVIADDRPIGILTSTDLYLVLEELLQSVQASFDDSPVHSGA